MIKDLLLLIIISFLGSLFNTAQFTYNSDVEFINVLGNIIFLSLIILYSYYKGIKKDWYYRGTVIVYVMILFIGNILGVITKINLFAYPMGLNMVAVYPILSFLDEIIGSSSWSLILVFFIELILMLGAYYLGKNKKANFIKRG